MKKIISILTIITLIFGVISISTYAEGEPTVTTEPELIFDLDFEEYNTKDKTGIKNAVTNSSDGITIVSANNKKKAPLLESDTFNGRAFKFLQFNTPENTNFYNSIEVSEPAIFGKSELTIELMFKHYPATYAYGTILAFNNAAYSANSLKIEAPTKTGEYIWVTAGGGIGGIERDALLAKPSWQHLVITRKYDATETVWKESIYLNGKKVVDEKAGQAGAPAILDDENFKMSIGGKNGDNTFFGGIADLKIYDGIISETSAEEKYNEFFDSNIMFNLDYSEYNPATKEGIKNSVTDSVDGISVLTGAKGYVPTVEIDEVNGVEYLQFNNAENTNYGNSVKVEDSNLFGKSAITIEAWIKPLTPAYKSAYILAFKDSGSNYSMRVQNSNQTAQLNVFGFGTLLGNNKVYCGTQADKWSHMVIAREYDPVATTWNVRVYQNGVEMQNLTSDAGQAATLDGEGYALEIGGVAADKTFFGGISDLKIYDESLSKSDVGAAYEVSKEKYSKVYANTVDLVDDITYTNQNSETITALTGATSVTASFNMENNKAMAISPKIIFALFDENGMVKCKAINGPTIAPEEGTTEPITVTLEGITPTEGSYTKLFVLSDYTNIIPFLGSNLTLPYLAPSI